MAKCDCYYQHGTKFVCYGTKEMEKCSCGGNESKCNFYPEKRKPKMANEKRLIDANPLIEMYSGGESMKSISESIHDEGFVNALRNAPTVDAVEVVRCKDCKKRYNPKECPMCVRVYGEQHDVTNDDGYCDYGERRTDA